MDVRFATRRIVLASTITWVLTSCAIAAEPWQWIKPEQKRIEVRDPSQLAQYAPPQTPRPATVSKPQFDAPTRKLSLQEAINIALRNSEVVRVLSGVTASTSGRTIYDVAITNTTIDRERATFDPQLRANQTWNRDERPNASLDPLDPSQAIIDGTRTDNYGLDFGLSKQNLLGGSANLIVRPNSSRFQGSGFPLNPQARASTEFNYTQPVLRGAGRAVNEAPIVLARIDTERSYFQYKNSVQSLVQGVIEAYWSLVFAKTDLWARQRQVEQLEFANESTKGRVEAGDANAGDLAQTQVALENFRATLLASQANVLQRQAALLNILGLPPFEAERTIPVTPMTVEPIEVDWQAINELAQRQRPDIIELKLILDADQQRLLFADNQAKPQLDGVALYRWNGLEGEVPAGNFIESPSGAFTDWSLGINFSVPLGLRRDRAALRQQRLIIRRDRANLQQGLHQMQHLLALNLRNLDQFFSQYQRFKAVRAAARVNLDQQLARYNSGIVQFIVVLQAIVDWGNSVSSEANALSQYNSERARLELQTGTILESHGITFFEERFRAIGPLGRLGPDHCYPSDQRPSDSNDIYQSSDKPSERYFNLEDPVQRTPGIEYQPGAASDLNEDVQFEDMEQDGNKPLSDEEINELLRPKRSSQWVPSFLEHTIIR